MTATAIVSIEAYTGIVKELRSADVTGNGKATDWARPTLAMLTATNAEGLHEFTTDVMIAAICAVYKPVTAKGKRSDTIGALRQSGWEAMAKRLTDTQYIMKNVGVGTVSALVAAFVASDKAKDSFAMLNINVKAAVKAASPVDESEKADPAPAEAEPDAAAPEAGDTVADGGSMRERLIAMAAMLGTLNDTELLELADAQEELAILATALNAANDKALDLVESMTAPMEMAEAA